MINHVWKDSPSYNRYFTPPPPIMELPEHLWPHQKEAAETIVHRKRMIYAAEMGTGKTLAVFAALEHAQPDTVWWVSSKSALRAFKEENKLWKPKINITKVSTYESLRRHIRESTGKAPQAVVFDESTALKSASAIRTNSAMWLTDLMEKEWGDNCYVILLTGTPTPKDYLDWWAQCEVARPGFLKECSLFKFKNRLAVLEKRELDGGRRYFQRVSWRKEEIEYLPQRLAGLVLRHSKEGTITDLPEKIRRVIHVEPTEMTLRVAAHVAKHSLAAISALIKLRQISDGFLYRDNEVVRVECPKDKALVGLLKEHEECRRIIIYAAFRASIDHCVEICRNNGWSVIRVDGRGWKSFGNTAPEVSAFQDTKAYPYLTAIVAHPASGGEGMTLTASPTIVYYSNTFAAKDRWQSEDRIHRYGSKECNIVDIIHLPTDERVISNLVNKRDAQDLTLDEIQKCYGGDDVELDTTL